MDDKVNELIEVKDAETVEQVENMGSRSNLNLQQFMNDMKELGKQVNNRDLVKPPFHYGSLEITNYLLWLMLGELMMLNDKLNMGENE